MGCTNEKSNIIYSSKIIDNIPFNQNGSYINARISRDFDEIEDVSKKENFYHHIIESINEFKDKNCLGYRKYINETSSLDNKYTFISYSKVGEMSRNLAFSLNRLKLVNELEYPEEHKTFKLLGILSENCIEWLSTDIAAQFDSVTVVPFDINMSEKKFFNMLKLTKISTLAISKEVGVSTLVKFMKNYKNYLDEIISDMNHDLDDMNSNKNNLNSNNKDDKESKEDKDDKDDKDDIILKTDSNSSYELTLKNVILFDFTTEKISDLVKIMKEIGINLYYFTDLIKYDEKNAEIILKESTRNTIYTINYSYDSENVDELKGVKLSQQNLSSQLTFVADSGINLNFNDVHYSYVQMTSITERVLNYMLFTYGSSIGFSSSSKFNIESFISDVKTLSPTFLIGPPLILFEFRNYFLYKAKTLKGFSKNIIKSAIQSKRENFRKNTSIEDSFLDRWALDHLKNDFGGKIRFILSFQDNLLNELALDLKVLFACPVIEVYSMSELGGICLSTHISDIQNNCIGGPITTSKVKIIDKTNIGFSIHKVPIKGELSVKGPSVFPGYFQNKTLTKKKLIDDWYSTGDIVLLQEETLGFKVIDSLSNIIKLSNDVFISPNKLERLYIKVKYVRQICIISIPKTNDTTQNSLMAIIYPNHKKILNYLLLNKIVNINDVGQDENEKLKLIEDYYDNEDVISEIFSEFELIFDIDKNIEDYEKIERIYLLKEKFSYENEMIDIKGRLNRSKIKSYYLNTSINKLKGDLKN